MVKLISSILQNNNRILRNNNSYLQNSINNPASIAEGECTDLDHFLHLCYVAFLLTMFMIGPILDYYDIPAILICAFVDLGELFCRWINPRVTPFLPLG